ncbi:GNAT family N-acetyltransferase [Pseudomonas gingeri]|uniref:GNAT family N-acetyltransferase n=1 Tax=Pseudomonas gingeri TaxID=117681 RepID=UPI0015A09D09|nr:GNAT family N-acetyltransferase [Pseudomonas gingeri]NVZ62721.1 GNAT family N-acetyltransferase [Pseudomonas gingeri]NVZ77254.1 GNAT family N-acetyltransferase [Pseudomonas gingeri]
MSATIVTRHASLDDAPAIAPLLDKYREFYGEPSNLARSLAFIQERFHLGESIIIVALSNQEIIGFTQLFPSFSSVTLQRLWILNDLYVDEAQRSAGAGLALLTAARNFAEQTGAKQLFIEGAEDNPRARNLYTRFGFVENSDYHYYHLPLHHIQG